MQRNFLRLAGFLAQEPDNAVLVTEASHGSRLLRPMRYGRQEKLFTNKALSSTHLGFPPGAPSASGFGKPGFHHRLRGNF